jgi:hypothetical protein
MIGERSDMPFLNDDNTEVQTITPERRKALLSGVYRTVHAEMMDNDPEYRDEMISNEKKAFELQQARYEAITKKYLPVDTSYENKKTKSMLTQLANSNDTVIE